MTIMFNIGGNLLKTHVLIVKKAANCAFFTHLMSYNAHISGGIFRHVTTTKQSIASMSTAQHSTQYMSQFSTVNFSQPIHSVNHFSIATETAKKKHRRQSNIWDIIILLDGQQPMSKIGSTNHVFSQAVINSMPTAM